MSSEVTRSLDNRLIMMYDLDHVRYEGFYPKLLRMIYFGMSKK
jgi:hypothetical protein